MGNCLGSNNKVLAEDDKQEPPRKPAEALNKSRVRFRLQEGSEIGGGNVGGNNKNGESNSSNGAVRIKLVVTQEELKQILSYKNGGSKFSSVEQLLSEMKLRRSVLEVGRSEGTMNGSWSPVLESIPEDH